MRPQTSSLTQLLSLVVSASLLVTISALPAVGEPQKRTTSYDHTGAEATFYDIPVIPNQPDAVKGACGRNLVAGDPEIASIPWAVFDAKAREWGRDALCEKKIRFSINGGPEKTARVEDRCADPGTHNPPLPYPVADRCNKGAGLDLSEAAFVAAGGNVDAGHLPVAWSFI